LRLLDPTVEDYGYTLERVRAEQELLNAAKKAGVDITPQLREQIAGLANDYASATVEAAKLAESQDEIRRKAEEMQEFQKEVTRGIVDGFIQGKKAADIFAEALSKVGNKLLDMAFDGIFNAPNKGGSGFNFMNLLGFREKGGPVKKGQPYVVGEKRPELFVPDSNGTIMPRVPSAPSMPSLSGVNSSVSAGGPQVTYAPVYQLDNATAEAVAKVERMRARDKAEMPALIIETIRTAQKRNQI